VHVRIYLKGWRDSRLYADAVNNDDHVLHAIAWREHLRSFMPYEPGDAVYLAVEYDVNAISYPEADQAVLDEAWDAFNVGDPAKDARVARYRRDRNRSLSVGDVIEIDGRAYTVDHFGFDRLDTFLRP
jgi:hypothetical protein